MSRWLVVTLAAALAALAAWSSPVAPPAAAAPAAPAAPRGAAPVASKAPGARRADWAKAIAEGKALATAESHPADALCGIDEVYGSEKLNKSASASLKQVGTATAALERVTARSDATDADVAPVLAKQRDAIAKAKRACDVAGNDAAKRHAADEG